MDDSRQEVLYVLTNPAFPDLLKLGRTSNLPARLASLSQSTALPFAFKVVYAARVADAAKVEQAVQRALAPHRVSARREFFRVPLECVTAILDLVALETIEAPPTIALPSNSAPTRPTHEPMRASGLPKEEALADLRRRLDAGESVGSQTALIRAWRRPRSTVSDWLTEWESRGLIPPRRTEGRCKGVRPGSVVVLPNPSTAA